jgi:glycerophosphoryl diester phosphodiesterase
MTAKRFSPFLLIAFFCFMCDEVSTKTPQDDNRVKEIRSILENPLDSQILVVAHRADWRNAPENSLEAIKSAIALGVDIVELDVSLTKDSVLILMHDKTINRTTSGKGYVKDWTYDSLKMLHLRNGQGRVTEFKIPTLKEALLVSKGKVMVNLDKCYHNFSLIVEELRETNTLDHVIIKAYDTPYKQVRQDLGAVLDEIYFMPIMRLENVTNAAEEIALYQKEAQPIAFELTFRSDTFAILSNFQQIKQNGSRVWVNSLWDDLNGGHSDNLALQDMEASYGWIVRTGANMIQTDRPELLIEYLRSKNLHN